MDIELKPLNLPGSDDRPFVIAGPCSAETEEQVMTTARQLASHGFRMFRAGVWKPRTKPGGFEGNGETALPWLKRVKEETGMLISTEVATPEHVELALKYDVDILWIGARTSANPFAMQAIADSLKGVDIPVFVKNPVNPDLELWIGAMERINQAGVKRLAAIHRGFSSYEKKIYRNLPMCDAKQQVTPDVLNYILSLRVIRDEKVVTEGIHMLRKQIDEIDNGIMELLAKRMSVCREIGRYKKEHNMTVLQTVRYNEILDKRGAQGSLAGMDSEFVKEIFEHIHEESVRQQMEIVNQK